MSNFGSVAGFQRGESARMNLGFETAAAERAGDFSVGKKMALAPARCGLEPLVPAISASANGWLAEQAAASCS
jgi:hypothetical protein